MRMRDTGARWVAIAAVGVLVATPVEIVLLGLEFLGEGSVASDIRLTPTPFSVPSDTSEEQRCQDRAFANGNFYGPWLP